MTKSIDEKPVTSKPITNDSVFSTQIGIWQFWTVKSSRLNPRRQWDEIASGLRLLRRLATEIFLISPWMLILFILSKIWSGVESAVLMHLSSRLLRIIEIGILDGHADAHAIYVAMISRLFCVIFVAILKWWSLRLDLATSLEPDSHTRISTTDAWNAFEQVVEFMAEILTSVSQFYLIVHASRFTGGPLFASLCIAKPFLRALTLQNVWSKVFLVNTHNEDHKRMQALNQLTSDYYRQDYITGNLASYILEEYEKAKERLGSTCTDDYWVQYTRRSSPLLEIILAILGDLPMVYCAVNVIINPTKFSVASIAVLQQSSMSLRYSLEKILYKVTAFQHNVSKLRNLYAASERKNKMEDGDLSYPRTEKAHEDGMAFELKDVTFAYPGSKSKNNALEKISLTIRPGQLVVIVGANGSGKSTIIKLLTRLYDPTSGTILIDQIPAQQYKATDLRQSMATFTQDHNLFPLSLYENIALGNPMAALDEEMVTKAAEQGGSLGFIKKLESGLDTILDSRNAAYAMNVPNDPNHPLQKQKAKLEKRINISGGEQQRVVASRTFMHLSSGRVKFVAVDEPSSALDPEGEFELFQRLIASRAGKTMIFVTHRFGHLTKHADMIICMKDGTIAELGSHEALLKLAGEYAKLYNIQADAFSSGEAIPTA
ncbi:putative multidrug export ATP-binding/permease protein YgaD [Hypsizygus marmoreus]|uniref:Multidrug export ATP-binding/permease protein YgaD n=1 Tax=Hypsizygus marmoreus TaxID=39966 RepID=A0A369JRJ5_HYPMA|nr:putative multidrug export ATP-binding/permease protein YgaD [Hypsizygus marmoreus]